MKKSLLIFFCIFPDAIDGFWFYVYCNANAGKLHGKTETLTFTPSNTDPAGTMVYEIYELPNTTVPLATVTTNIYNGLSAGTYRIIAKETVGTTVTTQQQDVTIANQVVTFSVFGSKVLTKLVQAIATSP